jgi:hypothetical protein
MIFCPNSTDSFWPNAISHSKSNLVLLPPGGVHCNLWTNHRTVLNLINQNYPVSKDENFLRTLGSVDTTFWQYSATFTPKPRPFMFLPTPQHTGVCWFNRNFDLLHSFQPISTSRMSCDWSKLNTVIRILKKRAREMSRSCKVSRTFEFLHVFGAAEKIQVKV